MEDDDIDATEDTQAPPVVQVDDLCQGHNWLLEEAREAVWAALDAAHGVPHLPSVEERQAGPPGGYEWPPPKKRWRMVEVHQEKAEDGWQTTSVVCDCGRKGAQAEIVCTSSGPLMQYNATSTSFDGCISIGHRSSSVLSIQPPW
jgi:hypothetical protein